MKIPERQALWKAVRNKGYFSLSDDKKENEFDVAHTLLTHFKIDTSTLQSIGHRDPPDCTFELNGELHGLEAVELVDENAKRGNAKILKQEILSGTLDETKEVPWDWTKQVHAEWSGDAFRAKLKEIVVDKERKICGGIADRKVAADCSKFWLIIYADETTLGSDSVALFLQDWNSQFTVFQRVFLLLSYEPNTRDCPLFEL